MASSRYPALWLLLALVASVRSHIAISYPGSRGFNLVTNGSVQDTAGLAQGTQPGSNDTIFPYGQQWLYPCGGLPVSTNRSRWPVTGGHPLVFSPGLQAGHSTALLYVNLGLGTVPKNYSLPMVPVFNIIGPTNDDYKDSICLPEVPLPNGVTVNVGDNATIQIVEAAKHGAALYSCVDITFVAASDAPALSSIQCTNSSSISFTSVSTSANRWGWYSAAQMIGLGVGTGVPLLIIIGVLSFFLWRARKQLREGVVKSG